MKNYLTNLNVLWILNGSRRPSQLLKYEKNSFSLNGQNKLIFVFIQNFNSLYIRKEDCSDHKKVFSTYHD